MRFILSLTAIMIRSALFHNINEFYGNVNYNDNDDGNSTENGNAIIDNRQVTMMTLSTNSGGACFERRSICWNDDCLPQLPHH